MENILKKIANLLERENTLKQIELIKAETAELQGEMKEIEEDISVCRERLKYLEKSRLRFSSQINDNNGRVCEIKAEVQKLTEKLDKLKKKL